VDILNFLLNPAVIAIAVFLVAILVLNKIEFGSVD
jgi:hypothetical protein